MNEGISKVGLVVISLCLLSAGLAAGVLRDLPIAPARTISFVTEEGSNMDVDVSPDGKNLVFTLLGDLYTLPVEGGQATQLTRGLALHCSPVWSPDGRKIAYLSDSSGSLHMEVRDLGGDYHKVLGASGPQLRSEAVPIWYPKSDLLAANYYADVDGNRGPADDIVYGLSGGEANLPKDVMNPLRIGNDGARIYDIRIREAKDKERGLYCYDQAKGSSLLIAPLPEGLVKAALSSDGEWLAYVADQSPDRRLCLRNLSTGTERVLVSSLLKEPHSDSRSNNGNAPANHFCISPDCASLFIGYCGKLHRIDLASGQDRVIPFTAEVKADLGPLDYNTFRVSDAPTNVKNIRSASLSPDGTHLVFAAMDRVYIMDLPGGSPRALASQSCAQFGPTWSPDGRSIAYSSWSDSDGGYLWRVSVDGGEPEKVIDAAGVYGWPAWSQDGRLLAAVKSDVRARDDITSEGGIVVISLTTGATSLLPDRVPLEGNRLAFSADGKELIYTPARNSSGGKSAILMKRDVSGQGTARPVMEFIRDSLNWPVVSQQYRCQSLSPDGRYVCCQVAEDLYLVTRTLENGSPVAYDANASRSLPIVRFASGVDARWDRDGKMLSWNYAGSFYRIDVERVLAAAKGKSRESTVLRWGRLVDENVISVSIQPDEQIALNIALERFHARGALALTGARIVTMEGDQIIAGGTLLLEDGRIAAVGKDTEVAIPDGVKAIDVAGKTIVPGFVDTHLHIRPPSDVYPQQHWFLLSALAYGATTARDPATTYDSFAYGELLWSGQMLGPRLYSSGVEMWENEGIQIDESADARSMISKRKESGGTVIKQYLRKTRLQRQWLLQASREAGLNMTNEGESAPILCLGQVKDGSTGIEHSSSWGDIYDDFITMLAKSRTTFTPTLVVRYGELLQRNYQNAKYWWPPTTKMQRFIIPHRIATMYRTEGKPEDFVGKGYEYPAKVMARIRHAGGRVAVGSHGNDAGIGIHDEIWALQSGGLTNLEALQAATIAGAEAIGIQQDVGSIKAGKIADLLVLNKNPLEDIHNTREILYVMKDGILYDGDTLATVWPEAKPAPEWRLNEKLQPKQEAASK